MQTNVRLIDANALKLRISQRQKRDIDDVREEESFSDYAYRITFEEIESAPTVETSDECRWIPCSERLPEEGQIVLIYERTFVHDATFRNGTFFFGEFDNEPDVSHWKSIPNPPNKRSGTACVIIAPLNYLLT